jgi:hypothetical protein
MNSADRIRQTCTNSNAHLAFLKTKNAHQAKGLARVSINSNRSTRAQAALGSVDKLI